MTVDAWSPLTALGKLLWGLRGGAAIAVMTTLVGGVPRLVQVSLAIGFGVWSGGLIGPASEPTWQLAVAEVSIGAALGVVAALPLIAARTAGRLVDVAGGGPYEALFGLLAGAVFVGIDGHNAVVATIVHSHRAMSALALQREGVVAVIARLLPTAVRLAMPWLVTALVVQLAIGVGARVAGRASGHLPHAASVPAAMAMMTAALVGTLSVAVVAVVRGTL